MAIVKNSQTDRLLKDAVVLDLGDLKRQGQILVAKANAEAEAILEQARAEADRLIAESEGAGFEQGMERGLAEGREQGRAEARAEKLEVFQEQFATLDEKWNEALQRWEHDRRGMLLQAREDVLTFAFALTNKIVHRIIEQDPTVVVDQLRQVLDLVGKPTSVRVHVHHEDAAIIDEILPRMTEGLSSCGHVQRLEDNSVGRGGCIVRTEGGHIDASIDTQLDRIARTLLPAARVIDDEPTKDSLP